MEWNNGEPYEHKNGHEVPNAPRLLMDIAEAELVTFADEDQIPLHELMYLQHAILGPNSYGHKLYKNYEDCATRPISPNDYYLLDIDIVPSIFTSAEQSIISVESGESYIVSDAYARYCIRLKCEKEWSEVRGRRKLTDTVTYVQLRDKESDYNLVEYFLNEDDSIDVQLMIDGWQDDRRPATPLQKVILARTLVDLLDPENPR